MPWEHIDQLSRLGFVGGLIALLILLYSGKLRWQREYDELKRLNDETKAERDTWKRAALRGTELAKHAVRVADRAAVQKPEQADVEDDT